MILAGVSGLAGVVASAATGGLGGKAGASAAGAITGALLGIVGSKLRGENWGPAFKAALKGAAAGAAGGFLGAAAGQLASGAIGAATAGQQQPNTPVTPADLADPTVNNAYPNEPAVDAETSAQNAAQAKAYGTDSADTTADMNAAIMKTAEPGTTPADYSQLGAQGAPAAQKFDYSDSNKIGRAHV